MLIGPFRHGSSLLLAKNDKTLNTNLLFDLFPTLLGRKGIQLRTTFLTYMLQWRLSLDSNRRSVAQHILVGKAAMVSILNFTRVSFKITVGDLKSMDLTGMDVSDQYIWSKSNFKKKMYKFTLYFSKCICCLFGVQAF